MVTCDGEAIRVDVPVGQLLTAPREFNLSVDRKDGGPLAVKVRLIPASAVVGLPPDRPARESGPMMATTTYAGRTGRDPNGEGLDHMEYGAGD